MNYVVVEKLLSIYLDEPIVFETYFSSKKEAFKCYAAVRRIAKETSALPAIASDSEPDEQPVQVSVKKVYPDGGRVKIAESHFQGGVECWGWR